MRHCSECGQEVNTWHRPSCSRAGQLVKPEWGWSTPSPASGRDERVIDSQLDLSGRPVGAGLGEVESGRSDSGAKPSGFVRDTATVARRGLRSIPRDIESVIPAIVVPVFLFAVIVGSLNEATTAILPPGFDFEAFQIPVAIIFAVTGVSRATVLVIDVRSGYLDRLLMTPVRRLAILFGLMVSDFVLVVALAVLPVALGFALGVGFESGPLGVVVFLALAGAWGVAFAGFPYAVALRTGSPAAVNSAFIITLPFIFLTTAFVPEELLSGWLETIATYNPVTYVLEGLRSLIVDGWDADALIKAGIATVALGIIATTLSMLALRGRTSRG